MKGKLGADGLGCLEVLRLGASLFLILPARHVAWISCLLFPSFVFSGLGSCLCLKAEGFRAGCSVSFLGF